MVLAACEQRESNMRGFNKKEQNFMIKQLSLSLSQVDGWPVGNLTSQQVHETIIGTPGTT